MKFEKILIISAIVALLLVGFVWYEYSKANKNYNDNLEDPYINKINSCTSSGGTVQVASCCAGVDEFPNTCLIGACGCGPGNTKEIRTCNCGENKCWDGEKCK